MVSMSAVEEAQQSATPALEHAFTLEHRPRAITLIDDWAAKIGNEVEDEPDGDRRIAYNKTKFGLLNTYENLNFMRLYIRSHMLVNVFGLSVDGTFGGIQALAMVSAGTFEDNSKGQLRKLAHENGIATEETGEFVDAVEVIAFAMKPNAHHGRGVRQQLIRRIHVMALDSGHLLTYNPDGPVGNIFSNDVKFTKIKERKPYRVYAGSSWVNENYHLIGFAV